MSNHIHLIQKITRGHLTRRSRLPTFLYIIRDFLSISNITTSNIFDDGRINSCVDEDVIVTLLQNQFPGRIYKPTTIRMWYDILIHDYTHGWLPVNIKTTTTTTPDNTGNLAMCVYSYTDAELDLKKTYCNGKMSKILIDKIHSREFNYQTKKDYYFLVVNKNNTTDIIINGCKGLQELTPNSNNLPFQVNWSKNREYDFINIHTSIKNFIICLQKPKPSWSEQLLRDIREM